MLPAGAPYPTLKMKMPGIVSKSIKIAVSIPPGPAPSMSMYQPGAPVPPVRALSSTHLYQTLTTTTSQYLANPPTDPEAANFYKPPQQQQQSPPAQWGPPSAGYANQGYNNQGYNAYQGYNGQSYNGAAAGYNAQMPQGPPPGLPLYNARDEQVPGYGVGTGFPNPHDEKNPFEDVKV